MAKKKIAKKGAPTEEEFFSPENTVAHRGTPPADNLPVPVPPERKELVLEGDPEAQLAFATKAANALMGVVKNKPKPVMIQGKQYLEYGDWQVLGRFYGATVEIEWTKPLYGAEPGKVTGYEARALVKRNGEVISSAEGMCTRDEKRWKAADEYAVRSMAQTRTAAKALRNAFGWVAELAGYSATPAEEMDSVPRQPMKPYHVEHTNVDDEPPFLTPSEQKQRIAKLLQMLGIDHTDKMECESFIGDNLELSLVESNFEKIISGLEKLVISKNK